MKFFLTNCIFLIAVAATIKAASDANNTPATGSPATGSPATGTPATTAAGPVTKTLAICPTDEELNRVKCLCYSDSHYLICDGSSNYFDFKQRYSFKTLVIRDSPKLPFWSEHITKKDDFVVESLIVLQNVNVEVQPEMFNDLLKLPTKSIKIVTKKQIETLNLDNMRKNLISVSVTGVPKFVHNDFSNFNLGEESTLEHLQLRSVGFVPVLENLILNGLPLKVIEITKSNLKGYVYFTPSFTHCPPENERVVIDLRENTDLIGFGFEYLFKTNFDSKTCHYHIDLSDNPKLDTKILISNINTLTEHGANMFIRIAGVELDCNCDLYKLYNEKLSNNIHSVQCKGKGFLDEIANTSDKVKALCKP